MSDLIGKIIREHMRNLHLAINKACEASLDSPYGVKVTYHDDASFTVELSPDVPPLNVYEYRSSGLLGYGFDVHKLPYVEKMISSDDTPGNGQ
jgi:hypothetical protein